MPSTLPMIAGWLARWTSFRTSTVQAFPGAWFQSGRPVRPFSALRLSTGQTVAPHPIGAWIGRAKPHQPAGQRFPPSAAPHSWGRGRAVCNGRPRGVRHGRCHNAPAGSHVSDGRTSGSLRIHAGHIQAIPCPRRPAGPPKRGSTALTGW
jgi:hypothetical protein